MVKVRCTICASVAAQTFFAHIIRKDEKDIGAWIFVALFFCLYTLWHSG